jgi:hypothetical protein
MLERVNAAEANLQLLVTELFDRLGKALGDAPFGVALVCASWRNRFIFI